MSDALVDRYGRRIRTLRLSLTPDCNFRCVYCAPPEGIEPDDHGNRLSLEETVRIARLAARMGATRVRLTGGEPLLRRDIVQVVAALRAVDEIDELSMTTNGSRLARAATALADAGLDRINVSLDSLDGERFARVTGYRRFGRVREGIIAARRAGFPIKVNVVALRGLPVEEILAFVSLAEKDGCDVRFLEFMPLCGSGWRRELVYPIGEIRDVVRSHFHLTECPRGGAPAQSFLINHGPGRVGFIAPLTEPFCDDCSRIRLSADGTIRSCLFSSDEMDVGRLLKDGADDEAISTCIREAVWNKSRGSQYYAEPFDPDRDNGADSAPAMQPLIRVIGG